MIKLSYFLQKIRRQIRPSLMMMAAIMIGAGWMISRLIPAEANNLENVSVTLSNSRLSFLGKLTAASGANTILQITSQTAYIDGTDEATDPLKINDSIVFQDNTTKTIEEIVDGSTIKINSSLENPNNLVDSTFYHAEPVSMTVAFTTTTVVDGDGTLTSGHYRILIPAVDDDTNNYHSDGKPDAGNFDYTGTAPSVVCPADTTGFTFTDNGTATANDGTITIDSQQYHYFTCVYTGTGADNTSLSMTIGSLVNPAPKTTHDSGSADVYPIIVQQMDGTTVVDSTTVKVGAIEAVKVSASVVPSLTFTISAVTNNDANNICGLGVGGMDVTTTADSVPFGDLTAGFKNAAQLLEVTTNAAGGAAVTTAANDQLGLNGGECDGDTYGSGVDANECIWDANVSEMDEDTEADWSTATDYGFGYSLHDLNNTTTEEFYFDSSGTFMARHFADTENLQTAEEIFNTGGDPTSGDNLYVCYRIVPDITTTSGTYYNYITYIATATF